MRNRTLPDNATLAGAVKRELDRKKRTAAELGAAMGWTRSTVSRRMTGAVPLTVVEVHRIADLLGIDPDRLFHAKPLADAEASA